MSKKQKEQPITPQEEQALEELTTAIAENVIFILGQPSDLQTVQVRRLWENRYRVNIFTGENVGTAKVAYSYFLIADSAGNIIASTPELGDSI